MRQIHQDGYEDMRTIEMNGSKEVYEFLIDYSAKRSKSFILATREWEELSESGKNVIEKLQPYFIKRRKTKPKKSCFNIEYTKGDLYFYKCCEESVSILKQVANKLYDWCYPQLLDDLCFLNTKREQILITVAHEQLAFLKIKEDELEEVRRKGLRIEGERSRGTLEEVIENCIEDDWEELTIRGHNEGIIPDRIGDIRTLKKLRIYDEVKQVPKSLEQLEVLEKLSITVKDVEQLPFNIGKLKQLRHLELSSTHIKEFPKEILTLQELEYLIIPRNCFDKIPIEILNLPKLNYLWLPEVEDEEFLQKQKDFKGLVMTEPRSTVSLLDVLGRDKE